MEKGKKKFNVFDVEEIPQFFIVLAVISFFFILVIYLTE